MQGVLLLFNIQYRIVRLSLSYCVHCNFNLYLKMRIARKHILKDSRFGQLFDELAIEERDSQLHRYSSNNDYAFLVIIVILLLHHIIIDYKLSFNFLQSLFQGNWTLHLPAPGIHHSLSLSILNIMFRLCLKNMMRYLDI